MDSKTVEAVMFESVKPHLVELRQRIGISFLSIFIGFIIAFTFHNAILGWMTKPLNEALIQVGKIVDSRNKSEWKIQESNTTAASTNNKVSILSSNIINSSKSLQNSLSSAVKLLNESNNSRDRALAVILNQSATSAKELTVATKRLGEWLQKDTNLTKAEELKDKSFSGMITTHQVGGAFFVALKVSFFAGILIAMPMVLWQIWLFVAPGLYDNEKKMVLPFVIGGSVMFFIGVLFAYYIVTPFGFQFLITFGSFLYTPLINIEDYVGFFTKIMFGFGLAFELPVFAYFLALLGLITDKTLKDFFKYAVIIIFIVAALLTPPDVLTQMLMAGPLILLYGLSILIVRMVNPYKEDDEDDDELDMDDSDFEELERAYEQKH